MQDRHIISSVTTSKSRKLLLWALAACLSLSFATAHAEECPARIQKAFSLFHLKSLTLRGNHDQGDQLICTYSSTEANGWEVSTTTAVLDSKSIKPNSVLEITPTDINPWKDSGEESICSGTHDLLPPNCGFNTVIDGENGTLLPSSNLDTYLTVVKVDTEFHDSIPRDAF